MTLRKFTSTLYCFCFLILVTAFSSSLRAQVTANFVASSVHVCQGDTVDFTNLSTGAVAYTWAENLAPFANTPNASQVFNTPGTFLISLVATDGVSLDTTSTLVLVNPALGSSVVGTDASCFGFTDGGADLTPIGGTPNLSLCFDGVDDYVNIDSVSNTNFSNGITVEAWVKPDSFWNNNDGMVVAFNTAGGANHFLLSYNRNLQRFIYFDDVIGNRQQNGNSPLGQWAHLVLTITNSLQGTLYINGVVVRSFTAGATSIPTGGRCSIGQEYDGAATSQHFDGCMDEVRIWNTALTAGTVLSNYNNSCGAIDPNHPNINSLTAYYSFNEGFGTNIFDRSGNNNHGLYNGATWGLPINNAYGCFGEGTGFAYDWSNSDATEDLSGVGAGTYTVTITDGAGCTATDSVVIDEPLPIVYAVSASPGDTLCNGDTVAVSVSGGYTYAYSPATGLSATSGANIDAFPTATTTYEIIAEDTNNCRDTSNFTLVVNPLPTAAISGTSPLCFGDSSTLLASGGLAYSWSTNDTTASITVTPASTTPYTVTVTDVNGCQNDTAFSVVVNPLPIVTFSGDSSICSGDSASITATGGNDYNWSTGANGPTVTVTPTADSTYTVITVDSNFCQSFDSFTVTVNALPVVSIAGDSAICEGGTDTLTASGGTTYTWSTGDSTPSIQVNPITPTTYTVTVTDVNICSSTDSFSVAVNAVPVVTISLIGSDTLCLGDSAVLDASGAQSYVWSTSDTTQSISVTPSVTTIYSVTGTDGNGCTGGDAQEIFINPLPVISITGVDTICEGDTTLLIASGADTYTWDHGPGTAAVNVAPATDSIFQVTGTDANGCQSTGAITVVVSSLPAPTFVDNGGGNLVADPGFATYQWYFNGSPIAGATMQTYTATQNGQYSVEVTNAVGCAGISTPQDVTVTAIEFTEVFTALDIFPNPNQGQFTVRIAMEQSQDLELKVVNLMGQEVYQHREGNVGTQWTHQINLGEVASGIYLLELKAEGQRSIHRVVVE